MGAVNQGDHHIHKRDIHEWNTVPDTSHAIADVLNNVSSTGAEMMPNSSFNPFADVHLYASQLHRVHPNALVVAIIHQLPYLRYL